MRKIKKKIDKIYDNITEIDSDVKEVIDVITPMTPVSKDNNIIKSALTLLKINQLIDSEYGGVPSIEDKLDKDTYLYTPDYIKGEWSIALTHLNIDPIAFYTEGALSEFLSYPDNIKLLEDFYMFN